MLKNINLLILFFFTFFTSAFGQKNDNQRIGIAFMGGFGFNKIPELDITTTNGKTSSISAGGGGGIALKCGYEFKHNIDLEGTLAYQASSLSIDLKNVSIAFRKTILSITPSYIIRFNHSKIMTVKIGGGFAYYFNVAMPVRTASIKQGFDENFTYQNALGFHVASTFTVKAFKTISFDLGIRYNNVQYEFQSSDKLVPLTSNTVRSPNGSGIDFFYGINYHF